MGKRLGGLETAGSTSPSFPDRLRTHDSSAWGHLLDVHGQILTARFIQTGIAPEDAEDLAVEVLTDVMRGIARYRQASFRGWVWTIASRRLADHWRREGHRIDRARGGGKAGRRLEQLPDDYHANVESMRQDDDLFHHACRLRGWSEAQQNILVRYLCGGLDGELAAREFGISRVAFYQRVSRLMRDLRRESSLDDEGRA